MSGHGSRGNSHTLIWCVETNGLQSSQRVGQNGPLLLQDFHLIDLLAHFDRERIPERVVHAKGAGAYGEFELTHDISDLVRSLSHTIDLLVTDISIDLDGHAHRRWRKDQMRGSILDCWRRERFSGLSARSPRLFCEILYRGGQLGLGLQQHTNFLST